LRLRLFFCHRYVSRGKERQVEAAYREGGRSESSGDRRNDEEEDERMEEKGKDGLGDDRSANLGTNGRVVELVETDLVRARGVTSLSTSGTPEVIFTATSGTVLMGVSGESARGESGSVVGS
jgi:hypothetical protein